MSTMHNQKYSYIEKIYIEKKGKKKLVIEYDDGEKFYISSKKEALQFMATACKRTRRVYNIKQFPHYDQLLKELPDS